MEEVSEVVRLCWKWVSDAKRKRNNEPSGVGLLRVLLVSKKRAHEFEQL